MNSDIPKQLLEINGIPVICRTLSVFQKCESISGIIIVVQEGQEKVYQDYVSKYGFTKTECIVSGDKTRALSVKKGLEKVSDKYGYVAIHDGVRCFITEKEINDVISEARRYGAAIASCRSTDTVKISDGKGFIANTPERNTVWRAQTPQVFKRSLILASAYTGNCDVTDDSMWAEKAGFKVKLVECSPHNIKLTTPDDMIIAKELLGKE